MHPAASVKACRTKSLQALYCQSGCPMNELPLCTQTDGEGQILYAGPSLPIWSLGTCALKTEHQLEIRWVSQYNGLLLSVGTGRTKRVGSKGQQNQDLSIWRRLKEPEFRWRSIYHRKTRKVKTALVSSSGPPSAMSPTSSRDSLLVTDSEILGCKVQFLPGHAHCITKNLVLFIGPFVLIIVK